MSAENPTPSAKIYWVDDDADILYPCMEPLQRKGYDVKFIESMQEALNRYEELAAGDLLIIDLLIPHIDPAHDDQREPPGIDLIRRLQERECPVPMMVMTVIYSPRVEKELLKMHISHILHKPVHPHTIVRMVESMLSRSQKT